MQIRYTNTQEEGIEFITYKYLNSADYKQSLKSDKNMYRLMSAIIMVFAVIFLVLYINNQTSSYLTNAIALAFSSILTFCLTGLYARIRRYSTKRSLKKRIIKQNEEYPEMIINIDSKTFSWIYGKEKGSVKLTEEIEMVDINNSYYLETRKNTFDIPKRVFSSEEEENEFRRLIHAEDRIAKTAAKSAKSK